MKRTSEIINNLTEIMHREVDLLEKYASAGNKIIHDITERNWENLQVHLILSRKLSYTIEEVESDRNRIYQFLKVKTGADDNENFYQVISAIDSGSKNILIEEFRALKLALLKAQGISWKIEAYVSSANDTMKELMNRIFPHRKGTLYSKQGIIKEANNNPMVLNRKL